jgi:hypothetical protein
MMRTSLVPALAVTLAFPSLLAAQEQDRKLLDRIQRPDMELSNPMQKKEFIGGGGVQLREAPIARAYAGTKQAGSKEFATRSFFGIKNPWFGNRSFESRQAPLFARGGLSKLDEPYRVSEARVREFSAAGKQAAIADSSVPVRPFLGRGGSQGSLDQISDKVKKEMTIDEVRELLNKPR